MQTQIENITTCFERQVPNSRKIESWIVCNPPDPWAARNFSGLRKIQHPWQVLFFALAWDLIPPRNTNKKLFGEYLSEFRVMCWLNSIPLSRAASVRSVFVCLWLIGRIPIPEYEKAEQLFELYSDAQAGV